MFGYKTRELWWFYHGLPRACPSIRMCRANGAWGRDRGARRRRCGDIVDDEQQRNQPVIPFCPKGSGGAWTSAVLALLSNVAVLPASHRLASVHAALRTRHILILGQAPRAGIRSFSEIMQYIED